MDLAKDFLGIRELRRNAIQNTYTLYIIFLQVHESGLVAALLRLIMSGRAFCGFKAGTDLHAVLVEFGVTWFHFLANFFVFPAQSVRYLSSGQAEASLL